MGAFEDERGDIDRLLNKASDPCAFRKGCARYLTDIERIDAVGCSVATGMAADAKRHARKQDHETTKQCCCMFRRKHSVTPPQLVCGMNTIKMHAIS